MRELCLERRPARLAISNTPFKIETGDRAKSTHILGKGRRPASSHRRVMCAAAQTHSLRHTESVDPDSWSMTTSDPRPSAAYAVR
jgi:hypothetical protein